MRTSIKTGSLLLLLLWFAAGPISALAATADITLEVEPTSIQVGDSMQATVNFSGTVKGSIKLNGAETFERYSTQSQSSVQFVNGALRVNKGVVIHLRANQEGQFTLSAEAGGNRSNAVKVMVGKVGKSPSPTLPPSQPNSPLPMPDTRRQSGGDQPFVMQTIVQATNPVIGQPILVDYFISVRQNVRASGYQLESDANLEGFVKHELTSTARQQLSFIDDPSMPGYRTALLKRLVLFPSATGSLTIDAPRLTIEYVAARDRRRGGRDPFGMFDDLIGSRKETTISAESVKINVAALPSAGQPADFGGAVGAMQLKAELDRQEVVAGEPFTLRLEISGEGNLETMKKPRLPLPAGMRVYSEKDDFIASPSMERLSGKRTFETILIADDPGTQEIGPIVLHYFDPINRQYKESAAPALAINVTGQAPAAGGKSLGMITRESVELRGRDLRYIQKNKTSLGLRTAPLLSSSFIWLWFGLWPVIVILFLGLQIRSGKMRADRRAYRGRKALKEAKQRLREAQSLLVQEDAVKFYAALHRAIVGFIADKLDAAAPGLERLELLSLLRQKGVSEERVTTLDQLWWEADGVRFGGLASSPSGREQALQQARRLLTSLGEEIRL